MSTTGAGPAGRKMSLRQFGSTDLRVSVLGLGASPLGSTFRDVDAAAATETLAAAREVGINFVDVAPYYGDGLAEQRLGHALGEVGRDDFVLATKVGRLGQGQFDFSAEGVRRSALASLERLGTDHVDLLQVHDVDFADLDVLYKHTLPELERLRDAGVTRYIGVTGFSVTRLAQIASHVRLDGVMSYARHTLLDDALLDQADEITSTGAAILNAAPLAMGLLTRRGAPTWHPAPSTVRDRCVLAAEHCAARGGVIEHLAVQAVVADERIASTVLGTADPTNLRAISSVALDEPDRELLKEVRDILAPVHRTSWEPS